MAEVIAIGGLTAYLTAIILIYLIPVIAGWKMFEKVGIPGWKSLIPIYNLYLIYKISDMSGIWAIFTVASTILCVSIPDTNTAPVPLLITAGLVGLVALIGEIIKAFKLSRAFGKGLLFSLLMLFLPSIGEIVLGFGSSKYEGHYNN